LFVSQMATALSPTVPQAKIDYLHKSVEPVIRPLLNQAAFIQPDHFLRWLSSALQDGAPADAQLSTRKKVNAKVYLEREVTPVLRPLFVEAVKSEPNQFADWLSEQLARTFNSPGESIPSKHTSAAPARTAVPIRAVAPARAAPAIRSPRNVNASPASPAAPIVAAKTNQADTVPGSRVLHETWFGPGVKVGKRGELQILQLTQMGATAYLQKPAVEGKISSMFGNGVVKNRRETGVQVTDLLDMGAIGFLQPSAIDGACDTAFGTATVTAQGSSDIYVANLLQMGAIGYLQQSAVVSMVDTAFGLGVVQRQSSGGVQVVDLTQMGATGFLQQPAVGKIDTSFGSGFVHGCRGNGVRVAEIQQMGATAYLQPEAVVGEHDIQWMLRLAAY
jgi:hypothetical protein